MSLNPDNISIMPSESSFKKHAEIAHDALTNFNAVRSLKSPVIVKTAVFDLIDAIIAFHPFIPFFLTNNIFQELLTSAYNTLCSFAKDNPAFVMPKSMDTVASINDWVQNSFTSKRGKRYSLMSFSFILFIYFFI